MFAQIKHRTAFLAAYAALLSILLAVLLPFYATYQVSDKQSIFGDKILICTAEGFRWINAGDELPAGKRHECPVCVLQATHYSDAPHSISVAVNHHVSAFSYAVLEQVETAQQHITHASIRAPPVALLS
jgi:hypothetical protein